MILVLLLVFVGTILYHAGAIIMFAFVKEEIRRHLSLGKSGTPRQDRGKKVRSGLERYESSSGCYWARRDLMWEKK